MWRISYSRELLNYLVWVASNSLISSIVLPGNLSKTSESEICPFSSFLNSCLRTLVSLAEKPLLLDIVFSLLKRVSLLPFHSNCIMSSSSTSIWVSVKSWDVPKNSLGTKPYFSQSPLKDLNRGMSFFLGHLLCTTLECVVLASDVFLHRGNSNWAFSKRNKINNSDCGNHLMLMLRFNGIKSSIWNYS